MVNLPEEELSSRSRLGFQLEQAFWFYDDFFRTSSPQALPKLKIKQFSNKLMGRASTVIPFLKNINVDSLIDEFFKYKSHVPTCGAIILNEDLSKCLMVKGYTSKSTWGFPKGKISKDELPSACAVREVLEETGFNIETFIHEEEFLQVENNMQPIRLYIIVGVSESTVFQPLTRGEIRDIQWHRIKDIKYDKSGPTKYFNVMPFMGRLKQWVKRFKRKHGLKITNTSDTDILMEEEGGDFSEIDPICRMLLHNVENKLEPLKNFTLDLGSLKRSFLDAVS